MSKKSDVIIIEVPLMFTVGDALSPDWINIRKTLLDNIRSSYDYHIGVELRKREIEHPDDE